MDFTGEHPQFVSGSHKAHKIMDILVAGFFTAMTFETRRAEYIRSKPKLILDFEGTSTIAKIVRGEERYDLVRTGDNAIGGAIHKNTIALWTDAMVGTPPRLLVQYVVNEGWESLDSRSQRGIIRVSKSKNV